ncbi:S-layer homology domain-containing protein, partial [Eubacteriales bacterium SGI.150]
AKYDEVLTAVTSSITGNTGTFSYQWKRNGTDIPSATSSTYKLVEDDIGKTITVAISSSMESGTIVSSPTAAVEKADGPAAPSAFTLTFTPNADGTTFTATIPTVTGGEYSFDGTTYSPTNTKTNCTANTSYTGYVRIAATSTRKASAATSDTKTSPKLTVATPTFTPNGASSFTGTQSVNISCTTAGAKIYYTTDGTNPTVSSTLYTTTLSLTSTTTVKAIAVNAGMNDSAIATATFTKYSGGGGGGGGSYTPSYTVSVDKTEGGTITVSPKSASKGTTVTLTVEPDKGYTLETITVTDKNGDEIELTNKGNGKYTFKMPASKVYVEATFMEDNSMLNFFVDVPADAYYYDAVLWAAENGITGGVDDTHFAPNATCTRAQAVTFLWRAAGSPAPKSSENPFTDVKAGSYYYDAVLWAVENGITNGTSATTFSPNATCSRGQIVTFLWRSQKSPASDSVNPFADVAADAYYNSAVLWAVTNGITDGTSATTFSPAANCTRAQIVTFLYRCLG